MRVLCASSCNFQARKTDGTGLEQGPPQDSGAPSANESMDIDVESNGELWLELDGSTKHPTGSTFSSVRQENQHDDSLDDELSEAKYKPIKPGHEAMTKTYQEENTTVCAQMHTGKVCQRGNDIVHLLIHVERDFQAGSLVRSPHPYITGPLSCNEAAWTGLDK
jgi:hypothetical protein